MRVPGTQLDVGADRDMPRVAGLSLNARAVHTSSQYADAADTRKLPSWTRLDVFDRNDWAPAGGYPGYGYRVPGAHRWARVPTRHAHANPM